MRRGTILVIACAAVAIAAQTGHADYGGLTVILESAGQMTAAGPRDVYRVYAEFTNPTDRVDSWYGVSDHPFTIQNVLADGNTLGMGFTNFGGGLGGGYLPPETRGTILDWDTYATIGLRYGSEGPGGIDFATLSPGFPPFIPGNSLMSSNASISVPKVEVQGQADWRVQGNDTNLRVMLMQLVVNVGEHVKGTINIDGQAGAAGNYTSFTALDQTFTSIPEPGSLAALLLLGGFSLRRNANSRRFV